MAIATAAVGSMTSSAVKRAGTGGVVLGKAAVTMTAAAPTHSRASRRCGLYTIALYAAKSTAANVTAVEWPFVASTAAMITQNTLAGYRRRNASGAVVAMTPSTMKYTAARDGRTAVRISPPSGPGTAWTAMSDRPFAQICATTAQTAAIVATTAMAVSTASSGTRRASPRSCISPLSLRAQPSSSPARCNPVHRPDDGCPPARAKSGPSADAVAAAASVPSSHG